MINRLMMHEMRHVKHELATAQSRTVAQRSLVTSIDRPATYFGRRPTIQYWVQQLQQRFHLSASHTHRDAHMAGGQLQSPIPPLSTHCRSQQVVERGRHCPGTRLISAGRTRTNQRRPSTVRPSQSDHRSKLDHLLD